ncbi:MAG: HD domain-containing protein [Candidatus Shapirobacteria bacterium]|jgi:GTP pyrophosphokinase
MNLDLNRNKNVDELWLDLNKYVTEWKLQDEVMIKKAFDWAVKLHSGQKRVSGEDFVTHPVWVAKVVTQLGVGRRAIVAALLHDTVEDSGMSIEEIAKEFDDEVALLVEALTEVKKKTHGMEIEMHKTNIEVFRKFLFSSVNDVRVLIIRIVDKLHNGLTIDALSEEQEIKYAQRIFGIYSPIAEYVGLHYFKRLLDDIAFKILYPKEAKELEVEISRNRNKELKAENSIKEDIEKMLKINHINNFEIQSRIKGLYSSYQKVIKYGSEKGLKDRVGLRILVNNIAECYTVLGLIHSKYPYIEKEFNDYISSPKANGYRSIQTTFKWSEEISVEIQIRTKEMHEFNEFGPASHIAYKLSKGGNNDLGFEWVKDLINWQKGDNNINNYRINVLEKFVYVFTPKGDTIQLKKGATGLDFAYRIHKEIGDHCSGVKINRKMGKIDDILETGDMVEVLTSKKVERSKSLLK